MKTRTKSSSKSTKSFSAIFTQRNEEFTKPTQICDIERKEDYIRIDSDQEFQNSEIESINPDKKNSIRFYVVFTTDHIGKYSNKKRFLWVDDLDEKMKPKVKKELIEKFKRSLLNAYFKGDENADFASKYFLFYIFSL